MGGELHEGTACSERRGAVRGHRRGAGSPAQQVSMDMGSPQVGQQRQAAICSDRQWDNKESDSKTTVCPTHHQRV